MTTGMRERVFSSDGVCDCSLGDLLENKKLSRSLYIIKHKLINIYVTMRGLFK
jgi:hypothetical protein